MSIILRVIPFIAVITLNVFAQATRYKINMMVPYLLIVTSVLVLNLMVILILKKKDYFAFGLSGVAITGSLSVFILPEVGQFYLRNIIEGLYLGLFLMAVLPQIFGLRPFSFYISEKDYPPVIVKSNSFLKLNNLMSSIWGFLFALSILLTAVPYSDDAAIQTIISVLVPIVLQLLIGIPINKYLPEYLMQHAPGERLVFNSMAEAGEAMPYGLDKELAKGVDTVVQFELTGEEEGTAHVIIKDQKCVFKQEAHPNPNTTIKADSKLWLDITNNKIPGDKAAIEGMFEIEGDASIMLIFADLFTPKNLQDLAKYEPREMNYNYKSFPPGKIKNIVVFDGGPRAKKFSKTTFMVNNFISGAESVGANVEYIKLSKQKIHTCSGCYTCWTKTPGECTYDDDMTDLRKKYREADLVVFASPLYIFSVSGIMKSFMDRLLPIVKPYMLLDKAGFIKHPDRFPEKGEQGFLVFSAAGFPDVDHNFDGLQGMFRMWDSHSENTHLMGEFFLTAAEMIAQPVYKVRREIVAEACYEAGRDVVEKGSVDKKYMQAVSSPRVSRNRFQTQADLFWQTLDGKKSYLKEYPGLQPTV
ncbi:MAG: hypothetical protein GY786_05675 [Proteobacteria bacterium]|nr:hypothetical protein [Pseudomonadota bacterium]